MDVDRMHRFMSEKCWKCHGEGFVANTDEQEPWSAWESLPPGSDLAVRMGFVCPISCPECQTESLGDTLMPINTIVTYICNLCDQNIQEQDLVDASVYCAVFHLGCIRPALRVLNALGLDDISYHNQKLIYLKLSAEKE